MSCPQCNKLLIENKVNGVPWWLCPGCHARYPREKKLIEIASKVELKNLNERRAEFIYNAARLAAIAAKAPIVPVEWSQREDAFRCQFLNVIEGQCGENRSMSSEELHDSWMLAYLAMGWSHGEVYDRDKHIHPDLVPYAQLEQLERDKDAVFVALCEIARQFIYDYQEDKE